VENIDNISNENGLNLDVVTSPASGEISYAIDDIADKKEGDLTKADFDAGKHPISYIKNEQLVETGAKIYRVVNSETWSIYFEFDKGEEESEMAIKINTYGAVELAKSIIIMHTVVENHDFLDRERWYSLLLEISKRDDLNTKISGLAMAILLEAGKIDNEVLGKEVEKRLSKGVPADLGATWFEGLSMKNHYTLIARLGLWEKLQNYISNLDEEEFKRALLFLRRAFADFTSNEKHDIAENIAEIWGLNKNDVSAVINDDLGENEKEIIAGLEEFDFDDI